MIAQLLNLSFLPVTYRIKLVLPLHVVLNKHDVVNRLLQFKRVLFAGCNIAQRVVEA